MFESVTILLFPLTVIFLLAVKPSSPISLSFNDIFLISPEYDKVNVILPPSLTVLVDNAETESAGKAALTIFTGIDTKAIAAIATIANTFLNLIFFIIIFSSIYYYNFILAHFT